jgi:hypothetical protein
VNQPAYHLLNSVRGSQYVTIILAADLANKPNLPAGTRIGSVEACRESASARAARRPGHRLETSAARWLPSRMPTRASTTRLAIRSRRLVPDRFEGSGGKRRGSVGVSRRAVKARPWRPSSTNSVSGFPGAIHGATIRHGIGRKWGPTSRAMSV